MLKKITLKNYMSHAHTVIEPAAGLTVLIGPNNCGKSAVVSALQTLCGNEKGSYMVRHNEKDCRVIVETDDGHTVEWFRSKGVPGYVLDGEPVHRVKKDVLEQIQDVLRLPKVVPSEAMDAADRRDGFDIHFATQKSPIFLLDEPPSRAATFFASASDAALLVEMQKKHRAKVQEAGREKMRLEEKLRETDALLSALDPVAELTQSLQAAEAEYAAIVAADRETAKLRELLVQLELQDATHAACLLAGKAIRELQPPPQLADASGLAWLCEHLAEQQQRYTLNATRAEKLRPLSEPPEAGDAAELAQLAAELEAAQRKLAYFGGARDVLRQLETAPEPKATAPLRELLEAWDQLGERADDAARQCTELSAERDAVLQEIRAWAERNPTCPTCGGAVDADALIHREHSHAK